MRFRHLHSCRSSPALFPSTFGLRFGWRSRLRRGSGPLSRSFGPPTFAVWHRFRPVLGLPTTSLGITSPRRPSTRRRGSGTRRRSGCHLGRSRQPCRTDGTILGRNHRPKGVGGVSSSEAPPEDLPRYLCFCRLRLQLRVALFLAWFASSGKSPYLVPVR
jgi:hypothetical protein